MQIGCASFAIERKADLGRCIGKRLRALSAEPSANGPYAGNPRSPREPQFRTLSFADLPKRHCSPTALPRNTRGSSLLPPSRQPRNDDQFGQTLAKRLRGVSLEALGPEHQKGEAAPKASAQEKTRGKRPCLPLFLMLLGWFRCRRLALQAEHALRLGR